MSNLGTFRLPSGAVGGMGGGGLSTNDPTVVAAFHRALLHGGMVVLALLTLLFFVWRACRAVELRRSSGGETEVATAVAAAAVVAEPAARRFLRITFGLLWVFDGVLQGQASMPLGLVPQVIQPAEATSPHWVHRVVDVATTFWSYHPVAAAASAVWIQVGIGLFLLVGGRTEWSRLAGVAGAAWGLVVWIFGEAFGQVFAPGLTWLFGAPGAAVFYVMAGVAVALPLRAWDTPTLGRWTLRGLGLFCVGMAVLQAWPGRGFWQGGTASSNTQGSLATMVQQMTQTPQPHVLRSVVSSFSDFDAAHGWGVNLFAVVALLLVGFGLMFQGRRAMRVVLGVALVLTLADWIFIEDFGFLGGTGTDPNSMIPLALLLIGGYLAVVRVPAAVPAEDVVTAPATSWRQTFVAEPAFALRVSAGVVAVGITLVGAAPMAVASTERGADPILARVVAGPLQSTDLPAPPVVLTDQNGARVSLADLRGKAVILTFLDPVCTTDCPVIGRELRIADGLLASDQSRVELVAVNANPTFTSIPYLKAFDLQDGLQNLTNWHYLTGTPTQLGAVWRSFGVDVEPGTGGAMMSHSDIAAVIDPNGRIRSFINTDPGPATTATESSFGQLFAEAARQVLGP
jgi:cytochrome oxidase Cu insertion factor (SCO1/SenC/PrrC family)